ncbi:MAG: hypothetical protein WDO19_22625 [Bacteroidota bacterium]
MFPILGIIVPVYLVCSGCKAGRPLRKTLPDQFAGNGLNERRLSDEETNAANYSLPGLPFYAVDTTIGGKEFTAIYLRNPDFDSVAFSIIKSYEPFAGSLLNMMNEQGIKGVLIDFRQHPDNEETGANFLVSGQPGKNEAANTSPSVNIVFLWNENSASRAAEFMNALKGSAMLAVKDLNNKNPFSPAYKQDCFNPSAPGFDGQ